MTDKVNPQERVQQLRSEGKTGVELAAIMRDEGYGHNEVYAALFNLNYVVHREPYSYLSSANGVLMYVSNTPLSALAALKATPDARGQPCIPWLNAERLDTDPAKMEGYEKMLQEVFEYKPNHFLAYIVIDLTHYLGPATEDKVNLLLDTLLDPENIRSIYGVGLCTKMEKVLQGSRENSIIFLMGAGSYTLNNALCNAAKLIHDREQVKS